MSPSTTHSDHQSQFLFQPILPFYSNIKSEREWGGLSLSPSLNKNQVKSLNKSSTGAKKKKMYFFFFFFCDCKLSEVIYWRGWSVAASFPSKIVMRGRWLLYTYHVLNNGLKQIENMKKKN